jgi:hypothetical protein
MGPKFHSVPNFQISACKMLGLGLSWVHSGGLFSGIWGNAKEMTNYPSKYLEDHQLKSTA